MPRKPHEPTDAQRKMVKAMSAYGIPQEDIAKVVGIDPTTLRTHYRDELDRANAEACAKVAENLYRRATGESKEAVTAAIFWLKTRAGWRETVVNEHTGPNGGAIVQRIERVVVDPKGGE